jgi:hypothetical protein
MGEAQATGLFGSLTPEQQARVLAYQGDETIMPADTPQTTLKPQDGDEQTRDEQGKRIP